MLDDGGAVRGASSHENAGRGEVLGPFFLLSCLLEFQAGISPVVASRRRDFRRFS